MSEETLETTIGQFKTKTKFLEFIGGKGQLNFISKEATIEGKYLSGLGLDGITFKLTICDEGTVNFDEVDTNQTTKEQRERLLEIIEEKTIRPLMKKMVINELPFFSTKEVSGKKISLYLAVDYVKPINKLANFLQEGEVKVDETHANKINSLMDLLGEDDDTETNNQEEVVVEEIKDPVKNESWRDVVLESMESMKASKKAELEEKLKNRKSELFLLERDYKLTSSKLEECKADIDLLKSRLKTFEPEKTKNGYIFNVSEIMNEKVQLEPEIEDLIKDKISKVKGINVENFMKLFQIGEHKIRLCKKVEDQFIEITDFTEIDEELNQTLQNSEIKFFIEDNSIIYRGELAWAEIVNQMIKDGFEQDSEWDKVCGSNSY
jgi:hypothetical protein